MSEREAFEAWASDNGEWPQCIERSGDSYTLMQTKLKWEAWQAARALPAQAGHVPEASCGECGKKASDGWALYCVACMEEAGLPAVTDSPPLMHSCTSSLGKTPDSTAQAGQVLAESAWQNPLHPDQISDKPIPNWTPLYRLLGKISDHNNAQHFSAEAAVKAFGIVGEKGVA